MGFGEFAFSMQMRDTIDRMVDAAVDRLRPKYRYAAVQSIDTVARKCTVIYNGETNPVIINLGSIQPNAIGQIVRVEGNGTDKFVADVVSPLTPVTANLVVSGRVGDVTLIGGPSLPPDSLLCNGQAVSRTTYAELFAEIGTAFGAGNGTTTFLVPDLRDRVPIGVNTYTRGQMGGEWSHAQTIAEMASHGHAQNPHGHALGSGQPFGMWYDGNAGAGVTFAVSVASVNSGSYQGPYTVQDQTAINQLTGSGTPMALIQPVTAFYFVIRTRTTSVDAVLASTLVASSAALSSQLAAAASAANAAVSAAAASGTGNLIYTASTVAVQNALLLAHPPTSALPLFVYRSDRPATKALQYTIDGGNWRSILTAVAALDTVPLTFTGGCRDYGPPYGLTWTYRTQAGVIKLKGLTTPGVTTAGFYAATVAAAMRPAKRRMFATHGGGTTSRVEVIPDGSVVFATPTAAYQGLDNVVWNDDPSLVWADLSWASGWSNYDIPETEYLKVKYAKDSLGRVWLRGLGKGGTSIDMAVLANLPVGFRPARAVHLTTTATQGHGLLRVYPNGEITWATTGGASTWVSFEIMFVEASAPVTWIPLTSQNGWIDYDGASFSPASYCKFPDGMVKVRGLIKNGTLGVVAVTLPVDNRPPDILLMAGTSFSGPARIDINGAGEVIMYQAHAYWTSMDSIQFYPEQ